MGEGKSPSNRMPLPIIVLLAILLPTDESRKMPLLAFDVMVLLSTVLALAR